MTGQETTTPGSPTNIKLALLARQGTAVRQKPMIYAKPVPRAGSTVNGASSIPNVVGVELFIGRGVMELTQRDLDSNRRSGTLLGTESTFRTNTIYYMFPPSGIHEPIHLGRKGGFAIIGSRADKLARGQS